MIPIKNIYYMLCYAWDNILNQGQETLLDVEALENIYNLLSSILIKEANKIIKSGIYKGYVECTESISVVRGRINLNDTLKEQSLIRNKIVCDFHEFSENIILNQILKTTMETLLTCKEVDRKYRDQMRMLLRNFSGVHSVDINNVSWSRINYNRNNKKYRLIINVCE